MIKKIILGVIIILTTFTISYAENSVLTRKDVINTLKWVGVYSGNTVSFQGKRYKLQYVNVKGSNGTFTITFKATPDS